MLINWHYVWPCLTIFCFFWLVYWQYRSFFVILVRNWQHHMDSNGMISWSFELESSFLGCLRRCSNMFQQSETNLKNSTLRYRFKIVETSPVSSFSFTNNLHSPQWISMGYRLHQGRTWMPPETPWSPSLKSNGSSKRNFLSTKRPVDTVRSPMDYPWTVKTGATWYNKGRLNMI